MIGQGTKATVQWRKLQVEEGKGEVRLASRSPRGRGGEGGRVVVVNVIYDVMKKVKNKCALIVLLVDGCNQRCY